MAPNDVELKFFSDREWDSIINLGEIDSVDLPDPAQDVWKCFACERIYFFKPNSDEIDKVYVLET